MQQLLVSEQQQEAQSHLGRRDGRDGSSPAVPSLQTRQLGDTHSTLCGQARCWHKAGGQPGYLTLEPNSQGMGVFTCPSHSSQDSSRSLCEPMETAWTEGGSCSECWGRGHTACPLECHRWVAVGTFQNSPPPGEPDSVYGTVRATLCSPAASQQASCPGSPLLTPAPVSPQRHRRSLGLYPLTSPSQEARLDVGHWSLGLLTAVTREGGLMLEHPWCPPPSPAA